MHDAPNSSRPTAAIFAAGGAVASTVARTLATRGYHVALSSHSDVASERIAQAIRADGGSAEAFTVDATNDNEVGRWLDHVANERGRLDTVFNGIGGTPASLRYPARSAEQPLEDFLEPLQRIVGSQFLTARHAARHMSAQGHGSIVLLSATLSVSTVSYMAGITAACGAIESLTRSLAGEYGRGGIRVNCVRGSGMPETRTIQQTIAGLAALGRQPEFALPPLGRPISVVDVARTVAFLASDDASGTTGQVLTVCAGAFVG